MIQSVDLARELYADFLTSKGTTQPSGPRLASIASAALKVADIYAMTSQRLARSSSHALEPSPNTPIEKRTALGPQLLTWAERIIKKKKGRTRGDLVVRLKRYVLPHLGSKGLEETTERDLLSVVQGIQALGLPKIAFVILRDLARFYRHMVLLGRCKDNPATAVRAILERPKGVPYRYPIEKDVAARLILEIRSYKCRARSTTGPLLRLAPMIFLRPVELRTLRWRFIDLEAATIAIPSGHMKSGRPHVVPLARQAVELLRSVHTVTGKFEYVFNGGRGRDEPISYSTLNRMVRSIGFTKLLTPHGFRTLASSWLNEQGWNPDAIERQLSHFGGGNRVRKFYNRAEYMAERRRMMQAWADHLDALERRGRRQAAAKPTLSKGGGIHAAV